ITLDRNELTLNQLFRQIELKTDFQFAYDRQDNDRDFIVTVDTRKASVEDYLKQPARQASLSFRQVNHNIDVKKSVRAAVLPPIMVDVTVSGTVSDQKGEPLPGVTVSVTGTSIGTATDLDGRYAITVPEGSKLAFSFIGFESQTVEVGGRSVIDITLMEDMASLEEVVVVGYGTQKKRDVTGAVNNIDNTKNETLPNTNVIQAMRGTVPGLSISAGGNAGSGNAISIRGQNSLAGNNNALIVVDGIIYNGQIGNLNPNDIAPIDVLKDASSTAIFGAKAANGVVLIPTKKGATEKPTIQFNSYIGTQDFLMNLDFESPEEYVQKKLNYQKTLAFRGVAPEPDVSNPVQYLNRDEVENFNNGRVIEPLDKITQPAPIQSYNLNIG